WLAPALTALAGMTLEIYLVHDLAWTNPRVRMLPFPLNLVAFWASTFDGLGSLGRLRSSAPAVAVGYPSPGGAHARAPNGRRPPGLMPDPRTRQGLSAGLPGHTEDPP